jgi:hypothetical protein
MAFWGGGIYVTQQVEQNNDQPDLLQVEPDIKMARGDVLFSPDAAHFVFAAFNLKVVQPIWRWQNDRQNIFL